MTEAQAIGMLVALVLSTVATIWRQHVGATKTREDFADKFASADRQRAEQAVSIGAIDKALVELARQLNESKDHRDELWHEIKALREQTIRLEGELGRVAKVMDSSPIAVLEELRRRLEALEAKVKNRRASDAKKNPRKKANP